MLFSLRALQNTCRECPQPGPLYLCGRHGSDEGLWSLRTTWTLVRALAPVLRERHTSCVVVRAVCPSCDRQLSSTACVLPQCLLPLSQKTGFGGPFKF